MDKVEIPKEAQAAIKKVEQLRDKHVQQRAETGSSWSVTGWRSMDWLLLALVLAFVLYVLVPHN